MSEALQPGIVVFKQKKKKVKDRASQGSSKKRPKGSAKKRPKGSSQLGNFEMKSSQSAHALDTIYWPLLLKGFDKLHVSNSQFTPLPFGNSPLIRPIDEYIKCGVIIVDKPTDSSSYEVALWIKNILKVEKISHAGTLDPKVSGCLVVCLDRATKLAKSQQTAIKEYVVVFNLHSAVEDIKKIKQALEKLQGAIFQSPPLYAATQKELRVRTVYNSKLLNFDKETNIGMFSVSCEAGTYIRTLCVHLGLLLGVGCHMVELRRVRSGLQTENMSMVTLHDILDAQWLYENKKDETYLRRVIKPLECLLTAHKRIFIKDSAVNPVCYGAEVLMSIILRYEHGIEVNQEIVIVTTKGEAVALATALMTTSMISSCNSGVVAILKRVLMEKDTWPTVCAFDKSLKQKELLIEQGMLDKNGKPNEYTPQEWLNSTIHYEYIPNTVYSADNGNDEVEETGRKRTASTSYSDKSSSSVEAKSEKKKKKLDKDEAPVEGGGTAQVDVSLRKEKKMKDEHQ